MQFHCLPFFPQWVRIATQGYGALRMVIYWGPSHHPTRPQTTWSQVLCFHLTWVAAGASRGCSWLSNTTSITSHTTLTTRNEECWGQLYHCVFERVWLGKDAVWQPVTLNLEWSGDLKELLLNFMGVASSYTWLHFCAKRKWKCCIHMCTPVQFGFPYCSFYRRSALILNTTNLDCYWK